MKRTLVAITAGLLLLSACGSQPDPAPTPSPAASPAAVNEDSSGGMTQLSKRGAKIEKVGGPEDAIEATDGTFALDFTVDAIRPDPQPCKVSEYSQLDEPRNGHRMAVDITTKTRANYDRAKLSIAPFAGQNWHYVDAAGKVTQTLNWATDTTCTVTELPSTLLPGSTYKGTVMLDVPAVSGTLVLDANGGAQVGTNNTFEWEL